MLLRSMIFFGASVRSRRDKEGVRRFWDGLGTRISGSDSRRGGFQGFPCHGERGERIVLHQTVAVARIWQYQNTTLALCSGFFQYGCRLRRLTG